MAFEIAPLPTFESYLPVLARGLKAFLKEYKEPFLVFETAEGTPENVEVDTVLRTGHGGKGVKIRIRRTAMPLRKREGANPFEDMITVGRASNNDIPVRAMSLSKFHAYFRIDTRTRRVSLADAGSKNGTKLRGSLLSRGVSVPVKDGDRIELGMGIIATFMTPESFANLLETIFPQGREQ